MSNKKKMLITPNVLTMFRFVLAFVVFYCLARETFAFRVYALITFTVAGITDLLDGKLARAYGMVTNFGKIADPIADKLLILGTFIELSVLGLFAWWWLIPIIIREVGVTVARFYFIAKGKVVAAEKMGKLKVALQCVSLGVAWIYFVGNEHFASSSWYEQSAHLSVVILFYVSFILAIAVTVYSGITFWMNNRGIFRETDMR